MKLSLNPLSRYMDSCNRSNETPYEVLFQDGIVELRAYMAAEFGRQPGEHAPLLLVPPVAVNPNLYDLHPDYSVVGHLLEQGFDVYLLSWGDTGFQDRHNSFATYFQWVEKAMDRVKRRCGVVEVSLAGYCSGGMLSAFYAALRDDVARLVMINTPIDFTPENKAAQIGNAINNWPTHVSAGRMSILDMPRAMYSYSGSVNTRMYQLTSPMAVVKGNIKMWRELPDRQASEINVSMADALQMKGFPGAVMQQLLDFSVNNGIVAGTFAIDGETVDLARITAPLLCCAGDSDGMANYRSVTAVVDLVGSAEKTVHVAEGGHVGSVFSTGSMHSTWSTVGAWLQQHGRQQSGRSSLQAIRAA